MTDLNALPLPELYERLAAGGGVRRLLELARDEDVGAGDATCEACIARGDVMTAAVVARGEGVVAGLAALPMLVEVFGGGLSVEVLARDGAAVRAGERLAVVRGPKAAVLTLERTALNVIGRLSGVATRTAAFVRAMNAGGPVRANLYDTRKTTPGLRALEKYAVRCGRGRCHRIGLFDAVLIKDNHIAGVTLDRLAATVGEAARRARSAPSRPAFVEVEVDSLDQLERLLTLAPGLIDIVLLDNMGIAELRTAVAMRDASASRPELEASGGVSLQTVRGIAETGVERISAGTLTHGAVWLDVAMDAQA